MRPFCIVLTIYMYLILAVGVGPLAGLSRCSLYDDWRLDYRHVLQQHSCYKPAWTPRGPCMAQQHVFTHFAFLLPAICLESVNNVQKTSLAM
jgi:hypothetical protein